MLVTTVQYTKYPRQGSTPPAHWKVVLCTIPP